MNDSRISRCNSFIQFVGSHARTMIHVQYNLGGTLPFVPSPAALYIVPYGGKLHCP